MYYRLDCGQYIVVEAVDAVIIPERSEGGGGGGGRGGQGQQTIEGVQVEQGEAAAASVPRQIQ